MRTVAQFSAVNAWRDALGLVAVPLLSSSESQSQYVMLNGTSGNFCLDFAGQTETATRRAIAWSCDVGHHVTFAEDSVIVLGWSKGSIEERYSARSVTSQIHQFHRHLERIATDRAQNISAHILRIYRRLRSVENDGGRSLRALLHLIASCAAREDKITEKNYQSWGLAPNTGDISGRITDATWETLQNDLRGIGRYEVLRPDFDLVVRHASGAIFQDAHLEAVRTVNAWLPGLEGPAHIGADAVPFEAGAYFTPPALARTLAEEAARITSTTKTLLIFDPACGSGELLKECLRKLRASGFTQRIKVLGWDKSDIAVDMARFVLTWEQRSWPSGQVDFDVVQQDSVTAEAWPTEVGILVMNPPFKSWNIMTGDEKATAQRLLGSSYKPNLAMIFAFRAVQSLGDDGTLAMIAPNSLLEGTSGKNVREKLAEALSPLLVVRLGEQSVFTRALVDAGMYVGTKSPMGEELAAVLWADSSPHSLNLALRGLRKWRGAGGDPVSETGFSVYQRDDIARTGGPWIARGYEAWISYEQMRSNKLMAPAKKLFDIKMGVRLGNDVFIVTKDYYNKLPPAEQRFFRPAVMNLSISDAKLNDNYYVFYEHTAGLPEIKTEQDIIDLVPVYFKERLASAKGTLASRRTLARGKQNWWELLEHRAWLEEPSQKLVSKYFGGARPFAFDSGGRFVVVVGNAWILEKGTLRLDITEAEVYLATLAYLNSKTAECLLKYVSVQVSGGQLDLTKKYTGQLLVPNLSKLKATAIDQLVQTGNRINRGEIEDWAEVDSLVLSAIGN